MKRDLKINFGVLDSLLGELYEFRQAVENMQDGVRIVPFENTDDAYKKRAQEVYDKYTNFGERMSNVGTAIDKAVDDFGNGLLQSVVDTVVGLVKLPYGLVQYVADGSVVLFCKMIGSPVPSWAGKHFNGTNDMISSVVNDPFLLIEGLAQGISDTYEDEGIVYMSGYVAGEALQIYMAKRFSNRAKGTGNISGSMSPEDAAKFNEWQRLKAEGFTAEDLYNYEKFGSIKTQLEYTTTSGLKLVGVDGKTTTILGTYVDDTRKIVDELGNIKSVDFGPKNGGFNVLNTPDELYVTPEQFWSEYNKPWLDNVISRRDVIKIATIPSDSTLYRINNITGLKELTGFGREYMYLIEHGYTFDWLTMSMMRK